MKIREIEGFDADKKAADTLNQSAKRMQAQATIAQAKAKQKKATQQLAAAVKPVAPM